MIEQKSLVEDLFQNSKCLFADFVYFHLIFDKLLTVIKFFELMNYLMGMYLYTEI